MVSKKVHTLPLVVIFLHVIDLLQKLHLFCGLLFFYFFILHFLCYARFCICQFFYSLIFFLCQSFSNNFLVVRSIFLGNSLGKNFMIWICLVFNSPVFSLYCSFLDYFVIVWNVLSRRFLRKEQDFLNFCVFVIVIFILKEHFRLNIKSLTHMFSPW